MTPTDIIHSQAIAARGILEEFGPEKALRQLRWLAEAEREVEALFAA
jgi:hypothetical protein